MAPVLLVLSACLTRFVTTRILRKVYVQLTSHYRMKRKCLLGAIKISFCVLLDTLTKFIKDPDSTHVGFL